jgi:hypothetical protein
MWKEIEIKKVDEIYSVVLPFLDVYRKPGFWFRGQSNHKWNLSPSITRIISNAKINRTIANSIEFESVFSFFQKYSLYKENEIDIGKGMLNLEKLMIMQHYNSPTRLLDWSESFFIALYYAVCDDYENDGAVWAFDSSILDKSSEDIDFSDLNFDMFKIMEKDYLIPIINLSMTNRMAAQQGTFTLCNDITKNHELLIEKNRGSSKKDNEFIKYCIPKEKKIEMLRYLHFINISGESLFKGLDGLGKLTREYIIQRGYYDY